MCTSFPTLFDLIDRHDDHDAGRLTPAQQDQVVDECFQCKLCFVNCPYTPGRDELAVDFPRLMLRADGDAPANRPALPATRGERPTQVLGRTDLVGRLAAAMPRRWPTGRSAPSRVGSCAR